MVRVTGPGCVALQGQGLKASARFYEQKRLGLERVRESPPDTGVFATEPMAFVVREPLVDFVAVDRLGWGMMPWLRCDDAQALHDSLVEAWVPWSPRSRSMARSVGPSPSWTRTAIG
jgi:hypothetical protein